MRKQDLIFAMLKSYAKNGESIFGEGTLEVCPMALASCARRTPPIWPARMTFYVSPSQVRRFNLHTGDSIEGEIRTPKTASAMSRCQGGQGQLEPPENAKNKDSV